MSIYFQNIFENIELQQKYFKNIGLQQNIDVFGLKIFVEDQYFRIKNFTVLKSNFVKLNFL